MKQPPPTWPGRSWLHRWLPRSGLSLALAAIWLLLAGRITAATLLVAFLLGLVLPLLGAGFGLPWPPLRSRRKALAYLLLVCADIVVANLQVARLILFRSPAALRSRWLCVPLALNRPEAIAVFAATISLTPGTVSCDLAADGRALLVHCLDAPDPAAAVRRLKTRYEARLQEIFA